MVVSQVEPRNEGQINPAPEQPRQGPLGRVKGVLEQAAHAAHSPKRSISAKEARDPAPPFGESHETRRNGDSALAQHAAHHQVGMLGRASVARGSTDGGTKRASASADPDDYGVHPAQMSIPGLPGPAQQSKRQHHDGIVTRAIKAVKGSFGEKRSSRPEVGHVEEAHLHSTERGPGRFRSASFGDADTAFATSTVNLGAGPEGGGPGESVEAAALRAVRATADLHSDGVEPHRLPQAQPQQDPHAQRDA